ncbi:hypothetical protein GCM10009551_099580 [Nocardiopsis tropica]|nr:hypothetical protein TTY48_33100 [Tsukamurella sp. TY48]
MKKSYHSIAVPTKAARATRRAPSSVGSDEVDAAEVSAVTVDSSDRRERAVVLRFVSPHTSGCVSRATSTDATDLEGYDVQMHNLAALRDADRPTEDGRHA